MLQIIIESIIVGLAVSVPMGPIGVLCIQRTITRGRWHGIFTGLGATTSDLIYASLVGLSMGYILDFINDNQFIIQLFGSIIIISFGVHLFLKKNKPINSIEPQIKVKRTDYVGDFISGFGLCFSNPLIIFIFIALFTQFQVFNPDKPLNNVVAIISILAGALIWWLMLTMLVGVARHKFNDKGLRLLNKIAGSVLVIFGIFGIIKTIL